MTLLKKAVIDQFRELQSDADPTFVKDYFSAFLQALDTHLAALDPAIAAGDAAGLASHAHAVKSTCANAGVEAVTELAARLETLGKSGSTQGAGETLAKLKEACASLREEVLALPELR